MPADRWLTFVPGLSCAGPASWWFQHTDQMSVGSYRKDKFCSRPIVRFPGNTWKHSFHTFLSIWMLVEVMAKESKKSSINLKPVCSKFCTSNIRAITGCADYLARCEHFNRFTLPKTSIEPQNGDLENKFPSTGVIFRFQPFQGCRFGR